MLAQVEGQRLRSVEDGYAVGGELYLAGGHVLVGVGAGAQGDLAGDAQGVFALGLLGGGEDGAAGGGHHLRDAVEVAQVDEEHAAVVALAVGPAAQRDGAAGVGGVEFAASMSAEGGSF